MTDPFTSDGAKMPPKPFTIEEGRRQVRSFVLRQGRFTPAQQRAFDELWPRFGLDYSGAPRDLDAAFGRPAPKVLEIGFGNGAALRFAAQQDPSRDYIGIEVHAPGVGRLLNALDDDGSTHVRCITTMRWKCSNTRSPMARLTRCASTSPIRGIRSATTSAA
ncbi:hypothetical protein XPR_2767 [Xanthomonas arboricola pv. pruni MAFF 301420]|uniref:tRNA (guanine(46)-N(7))-methyltransferase n=1 Tax=Xanthomonas arboricola pv. pruni MAFF 301420 TaxID=1418095 RepID=W4SIC9_9XANT|nr:hypothetical protein XPR_2767 [Xanthomonas arboricola pv. pruni MAFF 301420]GAE58920.1 hypothetical protein XPN_0826 [Xanthomonas arboricola pv. pruni MAFF 301427]